MRVLTVAHLTLVELWRQRTQLGFFLLALVLALPAFVPFDGVKINGANPLGLALAEAFLGFAQFVGLFLAMSVASGLVASDLERGTGLILLSKPIRREQVLLGKLLGGAAFMGIAWVGWGLVAGGAFAIRLGTGVFVPTFLGFAGSMVASWLVVAFCLFWSCILPANAVMGLAVIGWILASTAPKIADLVAAAGHPAVAGGLKAMGELLPIDTLSEAAKRLITGDGLQPHAFWSAGLIVAWWLASALVFSNRDLASGG